MDKMEINRVLMRQIMYKIRMKINSLESVSCCDNPKLMSNSAHTSTNARSKH